MQQLIIKKQIKIQLDIDNFSEKYAASLKNLSFFIKLIRRDTNTDYGWLEHPLIIKETDFNVGRFDADLKLPYGENVIQKYKLLINLYDIIFFKFFFSLYNYSMLFQYLMRRNNHKNIYI
jgi:hypothetical protein